MAYEARNYDHLLGLPGMSETLLKNHFTLYQGYVKNVNLFLEKLDSLITEEKTSAPEFAELGRRFGWEFNGMRLHELYFENIVSGGKKSDQAIYLFEQMNKDFGETEKSWWKDFVACGTMRGIGWVILYWDQTAKRLFNVWINEHDTGHLAGCVPLLVMDVFEHAYMLDYGLKKVDYIDSFMKAIDWEIVHQRFIKAS